MPISAVMARHFRESAGGIGLGDLLDVRRQRRALKQLGPHQLADIGIRCQDAEREATRPLWDVPVHLRA
jgi:uncharacterized protein YjiS (DUF1127 family)